MTLASILFSLTSFLSLAQGNPPPPMPPPPPGLPIDGPALVLLVLGLVYGIYITVGRRKKRLD